MSANVEFLKAVVLHLVHFVPAGVELDAAGLVLQVAEGYLPHAPLGHHPAGDGDGLALQLVEMGLDVGAVVVHSVLGDLVGVVPALLKVPELFPAHPQDFAHVLLFLHLGGLSSVFGHISIHSFPCSFARRPRPLPGDGDNVILGNARGGLHLDGVPPPGRQ